MNDKNEPNTGSERNAGEPREEIYVDTEPTPENKVEVNPDHVETREEIEAKIGKLKQDIAQADRTNTPQRVMSEDPRIAEKVKGPTDAPKEFGLRERILNKASEFWFVDRALQKRAKWFVEKSGIEEYLKANGQYLDVGTGKGHIVQRIIEDMENAGSPLSAYYGIDNADKPSKKVQRREAGRKGVSMSEDSNPMNFSFASADNLPFKDGSLDGVSYVFSIHHMSKEMLSRVMEETKRVIKKDGQVFIAEDIADTEEQRRITEKADKRINLEIGGEHNYKSDQEWQEYFDKTGFVVVGKKFFNSGPVQHGFYVLKLKTEI